MTQQHPEHKPAFSRVPAAFAFILTLLLYAGAIAQQKGAMTNSTVISMVKGGTSESVILYVMKNSETDFTTTPAAIQELKNAQVSQRLIDAMASARSKPADASSPSSGASARPGAGASQRQPYVLLQKEKESRPIAALLARVTSAQVERKDLGALASQGVVTRALEGTADLVADNALDRAASSIGSSVASPVTGAAKSIVGGLFKRKPKLTFLWSIPVQVPLAAVPTDKPKFEVYYRAVQHVKSDDFDPVIVRLVREKRDDWRLVGASEGAPDALESDEWEICDDFSQEEISCSVKETEQGAKAIEPKGPLEPGEYAVLLRPTSSSKTFSGPDIAGSKDEGRLFNSVWGFKIDKKK
jgi:hypothetical protein